MDKLLKPIGKPTQSFTGRTDELNMLIECLYKKRMQNCVLVGNPGCGKTEIIRKFAAVLHTKTEFVDYVISEFSVGNLIAGTKYRGEFEENIQKLLKNIELESKKTILFIDEIHTLWDLQPSSDNSNQSVGPLDLLKPALAEGKFVLIGATTPKEFEKLKRDKAFIRRINPIFVPDLSKNDVIKILKKFQKVSDDIYELIYRQGLTLRDRYNPDISLEILDQAQAMARHLKTEIDGWMILDIVERIRRLELNAEI